MAKQPLPDMILPPVDDIPVGVIGKKAFPGYPDGVAQRAATKRAEPAADTDPAGDPFEAAKRDGRLVRALPLDGIVDDYLIRDRMVMDEGDKRSLRVSLRDRGQQTPIEVVALEGERFGLISGWRRVQVLRELAADRGDAGAGTVLALVRNPASAADAYIAMVEENEIRVGLSYFERARIVLRAVEAGVCPSTGHALNAFFAAASRSKRSKIKSFLPVVRELGDCLQYPAALGERLGLKLAQRLEDPGFAFRLADRLRKSRPQSAEAEIALIDRALRGESDVKPTREEIAPGLFWTQTRGTLKLSGPALTPEIMARLRAALG
jgi:hypothetical protein